MIFLTPLKILLAKMFLIVTWKMSVIHEREQPARRKRVFSNMIYGRIKGMSSA